jgi:ribosomal protein L24E
MQCHWCSVEIDKGSGYWQLKMQNPHGTRETVYACWYCGEREIEQKVAW